MKLLKIIGRIIVNTVIIFCIGSLFLGFTGLIIYLIEGINDKFFRIIAILLGISILFSITFTLFSKGVLNEDLW